MKRIHLFLDEEQIKYLRNLPGKMSDHVRTAILRYINEIENKNVSSSESKGGGKNGT